MTIVATSIGFISGIQYKSGRCIYCRSLPMRGQFAETPALAHTWPDEEAAAQAAKDLVKFFQVRNPDAIKLFTLATSNS